MATALSGELFFCQDCEDRNRHPVVWLDGHLRCAMCGSDAVESLERLLQLQRKVIPIRGDFSSEKHCARFEKRRNKRPRRTNE